MPEPVQTPTAPVATPIATPPAAPAKSADPPAKAAPLPLDAGKDAKTAAKPADAKTDKPKEAPKTEQPKDAEQKLEVDGSVAKGFAELKKQREAFAAQQAQAKADADKAAKETAERNRISDEERKEFEAYKQLKANAKKKPYEALRSLGLDGDDIAKGLMHSEPEPPPQLAEALKKIEQLEVKLNERDTKEKESAQAETDRKSMELTRAEIARVLEAPEFKLARKDPELVFDVMTAHWARTFDEKQGRGEILDPAKAAREVEAYLSKFNGSDTAQEPGEKKKEAAPAEGPKGSQKAPAKEPPEKPVVLSNKTTADTPPGDPPSDPDANRKRAIRNLNERMAKRRESLAGATQ